MDGVKKLAPLIGITLVGAVLYVVMQTQGLLRDMPDRLRQVVSEEVAIRINSVPRKSKTRTWWFKETESGPLQQDSYTDSALDGETLAQFCERFNEAVTHQQSSQIVCPPPSNDD